MVNPASEKVEEKDETVKYRIVFLPNIEYDVIKGLIPQDNYEEYKPFNDIGIQSFMLRDSLVVFVPDLFKPRLQLKAKRGEPL